MATKRPLDQYPCSVGAVMLSIWPHTGPTSYTQITVTPGTVPITGGDTVNATEAGLRWFDRVDGGTSDDGAWKITAYPVTVSNPTSGVLAGIQSKTYRIQWIANKTATMGGQAQTAGQEAVATTNLSTYCVRMQAFGPK
jgi:hypothetical protein